MLLLVVALIVAVPLLELATMIAIGQWLGVFETIALLLALSLGGVWLVRRQGLGAISRIRGQLRAGVVPGRDLVDGAIILVAGALLLLPGFITDAIALLLLVPVVRTGIRGVLLRRFVPGRTVVRFVSSTRSPTPGGAPERPGPPALEA